MPNILDLSARLSADVRPFVNSMASGANASHTTFQNIAQAATMYLGARGLLGTLNRANQASMEFGQSLADASAISTLSVKEIGDALMSLDNVFGRVSKASQSMYRILSSGFSQLDASQLVQFQKAVGISAKVIRADLYNTADVMTTIANAYQLNIKEIEKLQDWFYITVREGKAQGQDLARTLGLVINSASEAGVSLNELGAAIAVLSRTQSVSQSMIGLNQMLNAFIKPTLQAQAAARKWGIEISATALQEKGLTNILTELNQKVGGNVEALEKMFGNIRAGRAILSLTGKQFHNYLNVLNEYNIGSGAGMEAFEKQIDTVQNAYERLQAQHEKTMIQIGDDWSGFRKIMYRAGEALSKAFSDTSSFSRWVIYINGINLAVKNIVAVVKTLQTSVERVTHSTNQMALAFAKASVASGGLGIYNGVRPDTLALRKQVDTAIRTVTGKQSTLYATYDTILRQANPWGFTGKSTNGINPKYNPYAFIARNTLSRENPEHVAKAGAMAAKAMGNYFIKYKPKVDPTTGQITDWYVKNAETGFIYKRTWNQLQHNMTNSILTQNEKAMQVARTKIADAVRILGGAKGTENQILQDATDRVNAFYGSRRGYRYGTISKMTSGERLMRMKNISPLSFRGQFGIGMSNFGKGWNTFTTTLGTSMGKIFTAVATAGMAVSVGEWGYKFGKNLSEQMELSETGFFRRLGGWLANYWDGWLPTFGGRGLQHIDYRDAERAGLEAQLHVTQGRYSQSLKRARTAGMDESKIAEYQLNFMKILSEDDNLVSATEKLLELVNNFTNQIDQLNSKVERANKFEKERQEILGSYGEKRISDVITQQQKVNIMRGVTDFGRLTKDAEAVRLARSVFDAGGNPYAMAEAIRSLRVEGYSEAFGEVEYANAAQREADFRAVYNNLLKNAVVNDIIGGNLSLSDIRNRLGQLTDEHSGVLRDAPTWFKDGKLYNTGVEGGHMLGTGFLQDILALFEANPNDFEEAKKQIMNDVVRPYAANIFTELLDDINDMAAEIGEEALDVEDLGLDVDTNTETRIAKAKRSKKRAEDIRKGYNEWLKKALTERTEKRAKILEDIRSKYPEFTEEEVASAADEQMKIFDSTFTQQADTERTKVMNAVQKAQSQEEQAFKASLKDVQTAYQNNVDSILMGGDVSTAINDYRNAYLDYASDVKDLFVRYEKTEEEITKGMKELSDDYVKGLMNLADTFEDTKGLEIELGEVRGGISYDKAFQERFKLYEQLIAEYDNLLSSGGLNETEARAIRSAKIKTQIKKAQMDTADLNRSIGERLSDRLEHIQLMSARNRITDAQASRRKIRAYRDAVELLNGELRGIEDKNSEHYLELLRKRREFLIKISEEQQSLRNYTNTMRESLLSGVNSVIGDNMQGDRLSSYGLYHATNLLARLAPSLRGNPRGVSLNTVLANANARYSGSTPDTSRAMRQQQRLSTIMDSYIAAKQYQDAGIGKNVQTIVTIMGKRTPLFLN